MRQDAIRVDIELPGKFVALLVGLEGLLQVATIEILIASIFLARDLFGSDTAVGAARVRRLFHNN